MTYEYCQSGQTCFSAAFLHSRDLQNWASVGKTFNTREYTACPTIRYSNGYYYLFYLDRESGYFTTLASRSTDLQTWSAPVPVLSPLDRNR